MCLQYKSLENTGKGRNFAQCFLPVCLPFSSNLKLSSADSFSWEESSVLLGKDVILILGKNCCSLRHKITLILYTDRHSDKRMDAQKDTFCRGIELPFVYILPDFEHHFLQAISDQSHSIRLSSSK